MRDPEILQLLLLLVEIARQFLPPLLRLPPDNLCQSLNTILELIQKPCMVLALLLVLFDLKPCHEGITHLERI